MTNVFLSWSGDQSKAIAEELRNWIPSVLQFARPYFTPNDIEKGAKWGNEISKKLAESNVGIICLTKENLTKPWILFEAGALSKDLDQSKVCSVLFGIETTDLSGPLTTFQTTNFEKTDFRKMMLSINDAAGLNALAKETFDRVFEMWWPQLHDKISAILSNGASAKDANLRSDRELLEEILVTARSISRAPRIDRTATGVPFGLVKELAEIVEGLLTENSRLTSITLNELTGQLIPILAFLNDRTGNRSVEIEDRVAKFRELHSDFMPF